ncbi:MAG TPA: arsenite efflux transporter metallochaperone ArsD [Thermoanaerobaculia bacterium]|nr:arsenite efflux transporter metallochaperone ArsD [Thermoanaerobaculia bacterium]
MRVEIFDPPLCCPTGICGPSVDPELTRFSSDLAWLAGQGVGVDRFNLAQQPQAFLANAKVAAILREAGEVALPLVLCQGEVVATGRYPSREALAAAAGLPADVSAEPARAGLRVIRKKCEPGSGCC